MSGFAHVKGSRDVSTSGSVYACAMAGLGNPSHSTTWRSLDFSFVSAAGFFCFCAASHQRLNQSAKRPK